MWHFLAIGMATGDTFANKFAALEVEFYSTPTYVLKHMRTMPNANTRMFSQCEKASTINEIAHSMMPRKKYSVMQYSAMQYSGHYAALRNGIKIRDLSRELSLLIFNLLDKSSGAYHATQTPRGGVVCINAIPRAVIFLRRCFCQIRLGHPHACCNTDFFSLTKFPDNFRLKFEIGATWVFNLLRKHRNNVSQEACLNNWMERILVFSSKFPYLPRISTEIP